MLSNRTIIVTTLCIVVLALVACVALPSMSDGAQEEHYTSAVDIAARFFSTSSDPNFHTDDASKIFTAVPTFTEDVAVTGDVKIPTTSDLTFTVPDGATLGVKDLILTQKNITKQLIDGDEAINGNKGAKKSIQIYHNELLERYNG